MSRCSRCSAEFSFFAGFLTTGGMVCPRCREKETLTRKLHELPLTGAAIEIMDALRARPEAVEDARRLAELDPAGGELAVAITAQIIDKGEPCDATDELVVRAAAALFARAPRADLVGLLLDRGLPDRAVELLETGPVDCKDDWLAVVARLKEAGRPDAALAIATSMRGVPSSALFDFVAETLTDASLPRVTEWLGRTRLVAVDMVADFLERIRSRSNGLAATTAAALVAAARKRFRGRPDELWLLHRLDEPALLADALRQAALSSDMPPLLNRLGRAGRVALVLEYLEEKAAPGPYARQIVDLAEELTTVDRREAKAEARLSRILVKSGEWRRAARFVEPAELSAFRARCADAIRRSEEEHRSRIEKAIRAAEKARPEEAHALLAGVIASAAALAPVARRTALALDAILAGAELDAAAALARAMELLAKRRHGRRRPLSDEGRTRRSIAALAREFVTRANAFLENDTQPCFVMLLPCGLDVKSHDDATRADAAQEARFAQAAEAVEIADLTEQSLAAPTLAKRFVDFLLLALDVAAPPTTPRAMTRYGVYGLLAKRLFAPLDPQSERKERTGPRELTALCAVRAVAFMPRGETRDKRKCADFWEHFSGCLGTLGYYGTGVKPFVETRPAWLEVEAPPPAGLDWEDRDHLPPLDEETPIALESIYVSTELDLTRAPQKSGW